MSPSGALSSHPSRIARTIAWTGVLAALILAAHPSWAADGTDKPAPYVLIHKDGYRIDAMEKPVRENGKVKIRLAPQGLLTILPETDIDWAATEKFNQQYAAPAPPAPAPVKEEAEPAGSGPVIQKTIVGSKIRASLAAMNDEDSSEGDKPEGEAPAKAPAPGSKLTPAAVAAAKAENAKELGNAQQAHKGALEAKSRLEAQISLLEAKVVNEPASSGIQDYESPSRKALTTAREQLASVDNQIQTLESRINELQYQASLLVDPPAEEE